jgi:hypothetical protein
VADLLIEPTKDQNSAMDLNNNMIGRTYVYNNMGYWPWQVPTLSMITSTMLTNANSISFNSTMTTILSLYDANNVNNAWLRLYLWEYYNDQPRTLVKVL